MPYEELDNGASKVQDIDGKMIGSEGDCENDGRRSYSRSEMEALRFENVRDQGRWWEEVYSNYDSDNVEMFDGLWVRNDRKQQQSRNDGQLLSAGKTSKLYGEILAVKDKEDLNVLNVFSATLDCDGNDTDIQEPLDEHEDLNVEYESSSDEYESIHRPAFFVEGEPDFESGPPLDGLEYLRRVRWETARVPKVKVVKLNSSKLSNEQTAYMPNIPEITKCPPNLLPSKDWENAFLTDFSELRQAISEHENYCDKQSVNKVGEGTGKQSDILQHLKSTTPTLTAILGMDAVCRAAALRKIITSLETSSALSREDCVWLFALCAAVDTPLHADTCASLRCLLRKCSGLLAMKMEPDDEVAMLSILVAITGKYFRQLDC